jgi:hypothetical protein
VINFQGKKDLIPVLFSFLSLLREKIIDIETGNKPLKNPGKYNYLPALITLIFSK